MDTSALLEKIREIWQLLGTPLLEISGAKVSMTSVLLALFIVLLSFRISKTVANLVVRFLDKKSVDSGVRDSIGRFSRIGVTTIGVLFALDVLGFSLSSLAALGAVLMVGIGFGLQNIAQNFISGIIILIERPVKVGDIVRLGETSGRVEEIRVRSTVVQTRDDVSIIVPNSKIIAEEVINESFPSPRIRLHVEVGVAYGSNLEMVQAALMEAAKGHPAVLADPRPLVVFKSFGDSSLDFDLRVWTAELWEAERVMGEIRMKIDALFRKGNIQIPFPQRDIHIKDNRQQ